MGKTRDFMKAFSKIYDFPQFRRELLSGATGALVAYWTASYFDIDPNLAAVAVLTYKIKMAVFRPLSIYIACQLYPLPTEEKSSDSHNNKRHYTLIFTQTLVYSAAIKMMQKITRRNGHEIPFSQAFIVALFSDRIICELAEMLLESKGF